MTESRYARYNRSDKGRARTRRYRESERGREVRAEQSRRYYHDPAHWQVLMRKQMRKTAKRRTESLVQVAEANYLQRLGGIRAAVRWDGARSGLRPET
jgi:hypothetical protein